MEITVEGVGRSLSQPEAGRGTLYTAWFGRDPVLCFGFGNPAQIDIGYVLILAGERVKAFTVIDVSAISGPRVSVAGKLIFRPMPEGSPLQFSWLGSRPEFGALAVTDEAVWLVHEHPRLPNELSYIDVESGRASDRRPEGAFYLRRWELVEQFANDRERTLARVPPYDGWPGA